MQFKYPEILYALLLLIIPIIVHLFQLQRFIKVPFTNVQFLKKIELKTRKSSQIKKWLILITRMLAFTCLIIAFAQPYNSKYSVDQKFNTSIYLDNSYSMQAKGENGELLKSVAQSIIENNIKKNNTLTILTNNDIFKNLDPQSLKNELINLQYSSNKLDLNTVLLQLNSLNKTSINTLDKFILISDFQYINSSKKLNFTNVNSRVSLLKTIPINQNNIFIDSIFVNNESAEEIILNVLIKSTKKIKKNIPVSLFETNKLVGKTSANFDNSNEKTIQFIIPKTANFNGKISLTDPSLEFDNEFYFSISKPTKINVLSIGKRSSFLPKIYIKKEFNFSTNQLQNLNYNLIKNQQLIILNEIENIPTELIKALIEFSNNGGNLVVIPSNEIVISSYNELFQKLKIGVLKNKIEIESNISSINYEHPLISDVFEKKITNFQNPKVSLYYPSNLANSASILKFDNQQSFISSVTRAQSQFFWIASPLGTENSNFSQSPLIVPLFYNFSKNKLMSDNLYYTISPNNEIEIPISIGKDNVLKVSNSTSEFIPLQQISQNKVRINFQDQLLNSGFYNILYNNEPIKTIAFNYNREESDLNYLDIETLISNYPQGSTSTSIDTIFEEINNQQKINWLFKWFLTFSVLFLFIEMLILKYFNI